MRWCGPATPASVTVTSGNAPSPANPITLVRRDGSGSGPARVRLARRASESYHKRSDGLCESGHVVDTCVISHARHTRGAFHPSRAFSFMQCQRGETKSQEKDHGFGLRGCPESDVVELGTGSSCKRPSNPCRQMPSSRGHHRGAANRCIARRRPAILHPIQSF